MTQTFNWEGFYKGKMRKYDGYFIDKTKEYDNN